VWRGGALSLGTVVEPGAPAFDPLLIARIRGLVDKTRARALIEPIGFRRVGPRTLGATQRMPFNAASAAWIARRSLAAQEALGLPLLLEIGRGDVAPEGDDMAFFDYLERIAAHCGCGFALDAAELAFFGQSAGLSLSETARRAGDLPLAALGLTEQGERLWAGTGFLSGLAPARIIRRANYLFPLSAIANALQRARVQLATKARASRRDRDRLEAPGPDETALAVLRAGQQALAAACVNPSLPLQPEIAALAAKTEAWQNWSIEIDAAFKGQQIKKFLARAT
jgi:hypothetical protein